MNEMLMIQQMQATPQHAEAAKSVGRNKRADNSFGKLMAETLKEKSAPKADEAAAQTPVTGGIEQAVMPQLLVEPMWVQALPRMNFEQAQEGAGISVPPQTESVVSATVSPGILPNQTAEVQQASGVVAEPMLTNLVNQPETPRPELRPMIPAQSQAAQDATLQPQPTEQRVQTPIVVKTEVQLNPTEQHGHGGEMPIDVKTDAPIEKAGQTQDEATPVLVSELPNRELDFDQVNVKVGETYNLYGNDFDEQLTDKILHKVDLNVQEFDIQLYPKELGEVHINVVFDSGKAVVSLICANEKAQQLLNAHAGDIRTIIETHTGNQTVVDVQKSERDMYQQQNPDGQSRGRQAQQQQPQHSADEVDIFIDQLKMGMRVTA